MILRVFAALSFAGLLTVAVATVGLKAASLRARARIDVLALSVKARQFELAHRQRDLRQASTRDMLALRLREVVSSTSQG